MPDDIPYGYCRCGCGEKTNLAPQTDRKYGWVKGEPIRFVRGHYQRRVRIEDRFWPHVDQDGPGGCWLWTGSKTPSGYGLARAESGSSRRTGAHRMAYELLVGPIPEGLQLDHLCCNPSCVNPDHLEPVTARVNSLRSTSPPAANEVKTHCVNGHEFTPENTGRRANGNRRCRACGRDWYHRNKRSATSP